MDGVMIIDFLDKHISIIVNYYSALLTTLPEKIDREDAEVV